MCNDAIDEVKRDFESLKKEDQEYWDYSKYFRPLSEFLMEYEYQKGIRAMTQGDVAKAIDTTQSAISRFESMKHPPNYNVLVRISEALGDRLFVSPAGSYCISIPYDLRHTAQKIAEQRKISVQDLALDILRKGLSSQSVNSSSQGSVIIRMPQPLQPQIMLESCANSKFHSFESSNHDPANLMAV